MQKKITPETLLMKNVAKIMLQISSHTRFKFTILSQKGKSKEMLFRNIFLILHTSEFSVAKLIHSFLVICHFVLDISSWTKKETNMLTFRVTG